MTAARVATLAMGLTWSAADATAGNGSCSLPAGTQMTFALDAPLSSAKSKTGQAFGFTLVRSIVTPGCKVDAKDAKGLGLVFLAGASGSSGHEGDLTIRPDTLRTKDGRVVTFDDQRIKINGKNRKIESGVLGFVPFAGIAAGLIRGSDVFIDANKPIDTVLMHPATVGRVVATPAPQTFPETVGSPSASPSSYASPTASESPGPSASPGTPAAQPSASPAVRTSPQSSVSPVPLPT